MSNVGETAVLDSGGYVVKLKDLRKRKTEFDSMLAIGSESNERGGI